MRTCPYVPGTTVSCKSLLHTFTPSDTSDFSWLLCSLKQTQIVRDLKSPCSVAVVCETIVPGSRFLNVMAWCSERSAVLATRRLALLLVLQLASPAAGIQLGDNIDCKFALTAFVFSFYVHNHIPV